MVFSQTLKLVVFSSAYLPLTVLARRGGRGGGSSVSVSGGGSDSSFSLSALDASIFAICVFFALVTALQALRAFGNIFRRLTTQPAPSPTTTLPVGHTFSTSFFLSTLMLVAAYILRAVFWAVQFNQADPQGLPKVSNSYINSWLAMEYLTDVFLILALLALINYRWRVLGSSSGAVHIMKVIVDIALILAMLGVGMGHVGSRQNVWERLFVFDEGVNFLLSWNLDKVYKILLLVAVVDIAVSSIALWSRAQTNNAFDDRKVAIHLSLIVVPLYMIYAVFAIVLKEISIRSDLRVAAALEVFYAGLFYTGAWDLAAIIINCLTKCVIIGTCLSFGAPPKAQKGETEMGFVPVQTQTQSHIGAAPHAKLSYGSRSEL